MKRFDFEIKIQHLWALAALVGIFIFVNTHPIRPHDFWWHMAVGREIVTSGHIPAVDVFSYTAAGEPYPSYQMFWLMEVLLYAVYQAGGPALVVFVHSLTITAAYLLVLLLAYTLSKSWRASAFGLLFAAALGMNDWNVRPQAITFFLGSLFLIVFPRVQKSKNWKLALIFPIGMVIWANSHGTFPLGLLLIALWLGQEFWSSSVTPWLKREKADIKASLLPALTLLGSSLACLINPRGIGIIQYLSTLGSNSVVQNLVTEWAPPSFDTLGGSLFLGGVLLMAAVLALSPQRPSFFQLAAFLAMAGLGLKTSRGIIWFGLVMGPVLAQHSLAIVTSLTHSKKDARQNSGSRLVNWIFVGLLSLLALISLPWLKESLPLPAAKAGLISSETPVEATEYLLENRLPGNVFHAMSFGSYLIWAAQPDYPVFVDGRIELYPASTWRDYLELSNGEENWEARLQDYGVQTLLLSRSEQAGLVEAVLASPDWELVYEDQAAVIFSLR